MATAPVPPPPPPPPPRATNRQATTSTPITWAAPAARAAQAARLAPPHLLLTLLRRASLPHTSGGAQLIPAEDDKWITLKITASALKTINKIGIKAALKDAKLKGFLK